MSTADRDQATLPMGLRERVMTASLLARGAGQTVPAVPEISAEEAFARAADAFYGLLGALSEDGWKTQALRGLDVQGLVGHLTGVEEDTHRALAGDPAVADAEHVESTQDQAVRQAGRSPALTRDEWRRAAEVTLELARAAVRDLAADGGPSEYGASEHGASEHGASEHGAARIAVHGIRLLLGDLLVVRAFELWVHDNDIRRAVGLRPSVPDPPVLRLMSDLAARMLPYAAARMGLHPVDVHLVLTGPGGGTWDVAIGQGAARDRGQEGVVIVADAVGFCRLAANRLTPAELGPHITGDEARVAGVLAAATTLALD
jgi:uncharacterized protein (TIGR03083 family)